jgi:hypothetical protein
MTSTIHADKIMNSSGDQDSGLDLLVNDQVKLKTANTDRVTITDTTTTVSNYLLTPTKPAWFVGKTGNGIAAQNPVVFDDVDVNVGSIYSNSTGKVTIPVAGNYYMFFKILSQAGNIGSGAAAQIRINRQPSGGSLATIPNSYQYGNTAHVAGEHFSLHTAVIATLALNDDITCQVDYQGYYGGGYTAFGGFLIG